MNVLMISNSNSFFPPSMFHNKVLNIVDLINNSRNLLFTYLLENFMLPFLFYIEKTGFDYLLGNNELF